MPHSPNHSPEYLASLQAECDRLAALADRIATAIVLRDDITDRPGAHDELRAVAAERDKYRQQIAWHNRATGWAWPSQPAWTD